MRNTLRSRSVLVAIPVLFSVALPFLAQAMTPTLSLTTTGSGDNVLVSVTGDPNSGVVLSYLNTSSQVAMSSLGSTNSAGTFTSTVSTAALSISQNSLVNVTVNSQKSTSLSWPYTGTTSGGTALAMSQSAVTLTVGQSTTITANNNTTNALYLSSNSTPSVANIALNGNQVTITGNTSGSTNVTVCSLGGSSGCATTAVTVQGATQALLFNQNNVSITVGQTVPVTVAGGTGAYVISSNSNSSVIAASVSGTTVNLYANASSGGATVTVCSSDLSSCGIITATAVGVTGSSVVTFSQTNPVLSPGQVAPITVTGGTGTYYVSSNSNSNAVQANVVGSILTLYGNVSGAATITVCGSGGGCGVLGATVGSVGAVTLSQSAVTLSPGQTLTVTISGSTSGSYYVSNNSAASVASVTVSGSNVVVYANAVGTMSATICQSGGQCALLSVTVTGAATTGVGSLTVSQVIPVGQAVALSVSGGTGTYYLSSNTNAVFGANLDGSTIALAGISAGSGSVSVCSTGGGCATIYVTVIGSGTSGTVASTGTSKYLFTSPLKLGSKGTEVTELQKRLIADGYLTATATGYYGAQTEAAVKKYQVAHGLTPLGSVGPGTRAALNK